MSETEFKDMVISIAKRYGWLVHHDLPAQNTRGRWMTNVQGDVGSLICSWCIRSKQVVR
jgi:hypothetical protein